MCGRFALNATPEQLQLTFELEQVPEFIPRFNIAPSQAVGVVTNLAPKSLQFYQWGLIPAWAKDPAIGNQLFNARSESAHEKPSFKEALRRRRCLVPATGFYEWAQKGRNPTYIYPDDGGIFAFAGLWETWKDPQGSLVNSCTILTTEPNDFMSSYHHRMAVIVPREKYREWLNPEPTLPETLQPLLGDFYPTMQAHSVAKLVNTPEHDSIACIAPIRASHQPSLF